MDLRVVPSQPDYAATADGRVFRVTPYPFGRKVPFEMKPRQDSDGYQIIGRGLKVHRLVLEAFAGHAPDGAPEADHINRCRADNRIENLRWASVSLNRTNSAPRGALPVKGIRWRDEKQCWQVYVTFRSKFKHICHTSDLLDAVAKAIRARREYGLAF